MSYQKKIDFNRLCLSLIANAPLVLMGHFAVAQKHGVTKSVVRTVVEGEDFAEPLPKDTIDAIMAGQNCGERSTSLDDAKAARLIEECARIYNNEAKFGDWRLVGVVDNGKLEYWYNIKTKIITEHSLCGAAGATYCITPLNRGEAGALASTKGSNNSSEKAAQPLAVKIYDKTPKQYRKSWVGSIVGGVVNGVSDIFGSGSCCSC